MLHVVGYKGTLISGESLLEHKGQGTGRVQTHMENSMDVTVLLYVYMYHGCNSGVEVACLSH